MIGAIGSRGFFQLRDHAPRLLFVLVLLTQAGEIVESEKDDSSLKTCHDREQSKEWYGKTKFRWQQPAGEDGGQSSRYVEKFSASRKVERDLCGDGRSGDQIRGAEAARKV